MDEQRRSVVPEPGSTHPVIVAEWSRNANEIVRISLGRYKNNDTIDVRLWYRLEFGVWQPTRRGLTLSARHLPALAKGFADALQLVREPGFTNER